MSQYPIVRAILRLLNSSKFIALLLAAVASSGLNISPEWQALIYFLAAFVYASTTALEDAAQKRAAGDITAAGNVTVVDSGGPVS